jgi:serine/threonine protein kinase
LEHAPGEGVSTFLTRKGVLVADATRTVKLIQKGYVRLDPASLLEQKGLSRIPKPTRDTFVVPYPASRPATEPVANIDLVRPSETVKMANSTSTVRVGRRVGRCLLTRLIGEGGGGAVYEAMHSGLGVSVAVKLLRWDEHDSPEVAAALRAEARLLAHLNHPNVVRVFDFDDEADDPYLVMELVQGHSLADLIALGGVLKVENALNMIAQAARGLAAALRVGIVHRDVKPDNILVGADDVVKITDLGLAACLDARMGADSGAISADECGHGGTTPYMAPERFGNSRTADFRADIYSLGVTLFEAVVGTRPFVGNSVMELMVQHVESPVPAAHQRRPGIPPKLSAVIRRMMAKNPADRHPSYEALLEDLAAVYRALPNQSPVPTWNDMLAPHTAHDSGTRFRPIHRPKA